MVAAIVIDKVVIVRTGPITLDSVFVDMTATKSGRRPPSRPDSTTSQRIPHRTPLSGSQIGIDCARIGRIMNSSEMLPRMGSCPETSYRRTNDRAPSPRLRSTAISFATTTAAASTHGYRRHLGNDMLSGRLRQKLQPIRFIVVVLPITGGTADSFRIASVAFVQAGITAGPAAAAATVVRSEWSIVAPVIVVVDGHRRGDDQQLTELFSGRNPHRRGFGHC